MLAGMHAGFDNVKKAVEQSQSQGMRLARHKLTLLTVPALGQQIHLYFWLCCCELAYGVC